MMGLLIYFGCTTLIGAAIALTLCSTGGTFASFFNPKHQKRICFKTKERVIICILAYTTMLPWAIGYWCYRLVRYIKKGR